MNEQITVGKPIYSLLPTDIEGFDSLAELALDMRWSWNHSPMKCGGSLIPRFGSSLKIPGSSYRLSRGTNSSVCQPILPSVRRSMSLCKAGVRRWKPPVGFSKIIHSRS